MLNKNYRGLVAAAKAYAEKNCDADTHTVAASLLTASGTVISGLNSHHYLGGPCAEVTALAKHAEIAPDDPVRAIVAIYGPTGRVISPCGKCRQILFDRDPAIECIVHNANGLEPLSVSDLLPYAYDVTDSNKPQRIYFWEGYEGLVREGRKRQTIRFDDPFEVGPARLIFEKSDGETVVFDARVTKVRQAGRDELTDVDAKRDGFANLQELQDALDFHYPEVGRDIEVDIVTFEVD